MVESELFGYKKGAFTGAASDKIGLLKIANTGTFFMDEIAEMTPALQVKLLRVLQEREALPVGATESIPVDVRVIAATNRDLEEEIRRGGFRSDLYYRLNVISLQLPPLRERPEDIPILAEAFLARLAEERAQPARRLSGPALERILAYDWPGNVRELENALEHSVTVSQGEEIEPSALPERLTTPRPQPLVQEHRPANPTLDAIERAYILWVLQAEGGNKTRAAEVLGIDPSTLYRKLARYESEPPA
jgi:two-component system response regulator HydG